MPQDWMKMECHTPHKPRLLTMAARMKIDRRILFTCWFEFWAWAQKNTTTGRLPNGCGPEAIDALVECPGFTEAALAAGVEWLGRDDRGLYIPRWHKHNSKGAKKRALTARRVAAWKARQGNAKGNADGNDAARPTETDRQTETEISDCSEQPHEALPACLRRIGVGEPCLSALTSSPNANARHVGALWSRINRRSGLRNPVGCLVKALANDWGVQLPKAYRVKLDPSLEKIAQSVAQMKRQHHANRNGPGAPTP